MLLAVPCISEINRAGTARACEIIALRWQAPSEIIVWQGAISSEIGPLELQKPVKICCWQFHV